ncbi:MAG: DUF2723 domain-containing protein [Candidatus Eisenbacteria bacterium]
MPKATSFLSIVVLSLVVIVYVHTSALSVSWKNFSEDSGDLLAASYILGIPHPTGYPVYVLLGRLFTLVMPGSPAFRVALLSIFPAALAALLLFRAITKLVEGTEGLFAGLLGSLSLAFSLHFWSQAVVAEVYSLHAFFTAFVVYLFVRWSTATGRGTGVESGDLSGRGTRLLLLAAYSLGLSFTNHMLSVITLGFVVVCLLPGARRLPGLRVSSLTLMCFLVPLSLYAYLPIRSARNPVLDWGNPETWEQFKWVVTGAQYRFRLLSMPLGTAIGKLWPGPFLASGWVVLGLAPVGLLWGRVSPRLRAGLLSMVVLDLLLVVLYDIPDFPPYFIPAGIALCFLAALGAHRALSGVSAFARARAGGGSARARVVRALPLTLASALLVAAVLPPTLVNKRAADATADMYPYAFGRAAFRAVEPNALIVSDYDGRTFALWFFKETEFRETHRDCVVALKGLLMWPWYTENLSKLYPDLSLPEAFETDEAMLEFVAHNIARRPVYTVREDSCLVPCFSYVPVLGGATPLYRVERN